MTTAAGQVSVWGNGMAVRLTKAVAAAAGVSAGTAVRIVAEPGRLVIEVAPRQTLQERLLRFDPKKHGGEAIADTPRGREVL